MECQILFSWKSKKNINNLLSVESAQRVVKVNFGLQVLFIFVFVDVKNCAFGIGNQ